MQRLYFYGETLTGEPFYISSCEPIQPGFIYGSSNVFQTYDIEEFLDFLLEHSRKLDWIVQAIVREYL